MLYTDGWAIYALHGIRVEKEIACGEYDAARIDAEANSEVRRVMTERYGAARYLQESGAKLVKADRWGKLWRKDQSDDEPLAMVEVLNSTPEPDGSVKTYFLRVPPDTRSPRAGLAWMAGVPTRAYAPLVET
jgi:hypothetical protein